MSADRPRPAPDDRPAPRRLYLHEPGWQVGLKSGGEREFCFTIAPGQDFYHRLSVDLSPIFQQELTPSETVVCRT